MKSEEDIRERMKHLEGLKHKSLQEYLEARTLKWVTR